MKIGKAILKKGILKSVFAFMMVVAMVGSQFITASAVDIGTETEVGKLPVPNIKKVVSNINRPLDETVVGDTLRYTITVTNDRNYSTWKNAVAFDELNAFLAFDQAYGVLRNGRTVNNAFDGVDLITVPLGNIAGADPGLNMKATVHTISFQAVILPAANQKEIKNTVIVEGINGKGEASDVGTGVIGNTAGGVITKVATNDTYPKPEDAPVVVGDRLKYTITASNTTAGTTWRNVTITDQLPGGLLFDPVRDYVYLNGVKVTDIKYDSMTRILEVNVGNVVAGADKVLTFVVEVSEDLYLKPIVNVATGTGDNGETTGEDETQVVSAVAKGAGNMESWNLTTNSQVAQIEDIIRYRVTATNDVLHSVWESVELINIVPLAIDPKLESSDKILVNGILTDNFTYDPGTRELRVPLGDIHGGNYNGSGKTTAEVIYDAQVNDLGAGTIIKNTAKLVSSVTGTRGFKSGISVDIADKGITIIK